MNNDFVQLVNAKGDIKVYKNIIISTDLLQPSEECSYYDEQIYNVFDLINKIEEKDKEIDRLNNIIRQKDNIMNELEKWLNEDEYFNGRKLRKIHITVCVTDVLDKIKKLKEGE